MEPGLLAAGTGAPAPRQRGDAATRLKDLNDMLERGLITRHEYEIKRAQIMSEL